MKNKFINSLFFVRRGLLLNFMKSFILLWCTTVFSFSSGDILSQNAKVKIDTDKIITIDEVFEIIRNQTDYTFIYRSDLFKGYPKVQVKKGVVNANKLLHSSLALGDFNFELSAGNSIVIKEQTKQAFVQQTISGTVSDPNGAPLAGVTVLLKGSKKGTSTDFDGNYKLQAKPGDVLSFSYLGFKIQTVTIGTSDVVNIVLIEDVSELDSVELIATGYQNIEKDALSGAASAIQAKDLEQRTIVSGNFLESLEGRLPGLVYNARNPNVPADEQLTIRGVSTFDGVKQPLIVLDGYPTEIELGAINPNNIESITVLRDAAASSIYGARAANGVIVINTKRGSLEGGRSGKPVITFRNSVAIQAAPDFSDLNYASSDEYIAVKAAIQQSSTSSRPQPSSGQPTPVETIIFDLKQGLITQEQADAKLAQLGQYYNLDEYQELFYRPSITQNYELTIGGQSEFNKYRLGFNYIKKEADQRYKENGRAIFNFSDVYDLSDRITVDVSGVYTNDRNSGRGNVPSYSSLLPYQRLMDDNGAALPDFNNSFVGNQDINNQGIALGLYDRWRYPYSDFTSEYNDNRKNGLRGQIRVTTKLTDWLNFQVGGAMEHEGGEQNRLLKENNFVVRDLLNRSAQQSEATGLPLFTHIPQGDILKRLDTKLNGYTFRGQLDIDYKFGNNVTHNISGIIGAEVRKTVAQTNLSSYFGYDGNSLLISGIDLNLLASRAVISGFPSLRYGNPSVNIDDYFRETHSDRRTRSYYSQMTYQLNKKYILTGSIRLDQSNLFGSNPEFRNKPQWSVGGPWLLHKETFMDGTDNWLNEFKLRSAYGLTGNVPTSNSGKFLILKNGLRGDVTPRVPYNFVRFPENQSLRWENTENLNVGLDFGFFNNRISGSVDWYRKTTSDVLGTTVADPTTGFTNFLSNTAKIENKGLEIWLNSRNISNDTFKWTSGLTASFNKNEVLEVYNTNANSFRVNYYFDSNDPYQGYALNSLVSYNYAGLNEFGIPTMITNDGAVQSVSGSDQILLKDLVNSGTTTPKYVIGLNNQISIGNFDVFAMLMYYGGHVMRVQQPRVDDSYPIQGAGSFWKNPGDEAFTDVPRVRPPFADPNYSASSFGNSIYSRADRYVAKADQINLTDVAITYSLPDSLLDNTQIYNMQFRIQAQNLWKYNFSDNSLDSHAIDPVSGVRGIQTQPLYSLTFTAQF